MSRTRRTPMTHLLAVLLLAAAFGASGCSQTTRITKVLPATPLAPEANTSNGIVERFRWCSANRSLAHYRGLFTSDFVFEFADADTGGNSYWSQNPWIREDELVFAQHLFEGGGTEPPATSVTMEFAGTPMALPDTRPGKDPRWHRQLDVSVLMMIQRASNDIEVRGEARFHVVRGDSAAIPPDLGLGPDSTRWYIERLEDLTIQGQSVRPGALAPQPGSSRSLGWIRMFYRSPITSGPEAGPR